MLSRRRGSQPARSRKWDRFYHLDSVPGIHNPTGGALSFLDEKVTDKEGIDSRRVETSNG